MSITNIVVSLLFLSIFTGCSSSVTTSNEVAIEMCELAKKADIDGMQKYATVEFAKEFQELSTVFKEAKATQKGQKKLAQQVELMKNIDCEATTEIVEHSDGTKRVINRATQQEFTLIEIDGVWRITF